MTKLKSLFGCNACSCLRSKREEKRFSGKNARSEDHDGELKVSKDATQISAASQGSQNAENVEKEQGNRGKEADRR